MMRRRLAIVSLLLVVMGFASAQDPAQETVRTETSEQYGTYLVDGLGQTLYLFVNEEQEGMGPEQMTEGVRQAAAACTGPCLEAWPPFDAPGGVAAGAGVSGDLLYTENIDGIDQVVYNGWPLYYFARDEQPGEVNGQGIESFGGEWYLVSAQGEINEAGEEGGRQATTTPGAALEEVRVLLQEGGLGARPTPQVVEAFEAWGRALEAGDAELQVVAAAVDPVAAALTAEPFEQAPLVQALQELALTMRVAAGEASADEASALVEVASLVDQTAQLVAEEGFEPRLEVEAP